MRSRQQQLSLFFGAVALAFFCLGVNAYFRAGVSPTVRGWLIPKEAAQSFGSLTVGEEATVHFMIANTSQRVVRIIGSDAICYQAACLEPMDLPMTLTPGETRLLDLKVLARNPGAFSKQVTLYTDCDESREVVLGVGGYVISRPGHG